MVVGLWWRQPQWPPSAAHAANRLLLLADGADYGLLVVARAGERSCSARTPQSEAPRSMSVGVSGVGVHASMGVEVTAASMTRAGDEPRVVVSALEYA